jgi:hypothetical protein
VNVRADDLATTTGSTQIDLPALRLFVPNMDASYTFLPSDEADTGACMPQRAVGLIF